MERGINLGGAFDRRDGQPGWQIRPEVLDAIAVAGFSSVRLPVRWAGASLAEVAEVVEAVVTRGLSVVVTNHHDDEAMAEGHGAAGRLAELWRGLATHFLGFRGELAFELLNEPLMGAADWNGLLPEVLASVRDVDPDRLVVVGGADASSVAGLRRLELPADDRVVVTVHYYEPFRFTHQGAGWLPGADAWLGTTWAPPPTEQPSPRTSRRPLPGLARTACRCISASSAPWRRPTEPRGWPGRPGCGASSNASRSRGRTGTSPPSSAPTTSRGALGMPSCWTPCSEHSSITPATTAACPTSSGRTAPATDAGAGRASERVTSPGA